MSIHFGASTPRASLDLSHRHDPGSKPLTSSIRPCPAHITQQVKEKADEFALVKEQFKHVQNTEMFTDLCELYNVKIADPDHRRKMIDAVASELAAKVVPVTPHFDGWEFPPAAPTHPSATAVSSQPTSPANTAAFYPTSRVQPTSRVHPTSVIVAPSSAAFYARHNTPHITKTVPARTKPPAHLEEFPPYHERRPF